MNFSKILLATPIVLIILAIVVFALNPSERSRQSRDQQRVADLENLKKALDFYLSKNAKAGVEIEALFCEDCEIGKDIFSYRKVAIGSHQTIERKYSYVNGSGWVPIDFSANMKINETPLKQLPLDPLEQSLNLRKKFPFLSNFYPETETFVYTFTPGEDGKYKLTAKMESQSGLDKASSDGGTIEERFEIGSDLTLVP